MKNKKFEPMKAYNKKEDLSGIKFPKLVSYKVDGVRCVLKDGELLSRSLKQIVNKQIREKFTPLANYAKEQNIILDGEIYAHGVNLSLISSCVMTIDYNDKKSVVAWEKLLIKHKVNITREEVFNKLKYYSFDCVNQENFNEPFEDRIDTLQDIGNMEEFNEIFVEVEQDPIEEYKHVELYFDKALEDGYEGLMLKASNSVYKCGRTTFKEDTMHKVKPIENFDAKIIGVIQSTEVNPNADKKINELGRSVTSKKKEDRILIEKASAFIVLYNGKEVKPVLSMIDEEKEEVWANRDSYIGKMIEYKGMLYGSLDVPRSPIMLWFREDLDQ